MCFVLAAGEIDGLNVFPIPLEKKKMEARYVLLNTKRVRGVNQARHQI